MCWPISVLLACLVLWMSPAQSQRPDSESFLLKVTLYDPGAEAHLQTAIKPGIPFEWSENHGKAKITIKGRLGFRQKDHYHLQITIVEWASPTQNSTETYESDLVPGKPGGGGFVSSFVYQRTFLLVAIPSQ